MNNFPKDVENIIRAFLFRCRICLVMYEYPMYTTCTKCVTEYRNVCKECFIIINKTFCHCHGKVFVFINKHKSK